MDLKKTIRLKGLRQCDIAAKLGVSAPTVSKWANGSADVPPRMIKPLADMLGVHVEDVLPSGESAA